ncbi:MAG: hypothetical protein ACSW8A_02340 [Lachnospiraceae bacterium]
MREYELVWEILNECANNQMRDVFIEELATDDPEAEVRKRLKDADQAVITREDMTDGSIVFHVDNHGMIEKYTFSPF